jgi:hypothetical protein
MRCEFGIAEYSIYVCTEAVHLGPWVHYALVLKLFDALDNTVLAKWSIETRGTGTYIAYSTGKGLTIRPTFECNNIRISE